MAGHFAAIFSVLTHTLTRRHVAGLAFGAGAPANGIGIYALDGDTYVDLFRAYTPDKWVNEWFDFRAIDNGGYSRTRAVPGFARRRLPGPSRLHKFS